jgi:hypothetical protein
MVLLFPATQQAFRLSPIELPRDWAGPFQVLRLDWSMNTMMITVFGRRTMVGLVQFYSLGSAQAVAGLLKSLQRNGHGFAFDAADVAAIPIFSDN